MYVCICIYVYVCVYIYIYMCVCVYIYIYIYIYITIIIMRLGVRSPPGRRGSRRRAGPPWMRLGEGQRLHVVRFPFLEIKRASLSLAESRKGQMGSALMGSDCEFHFFFVGGTFWALLLTYFYRRPG